MYGNFPDNGRSTPGSGSLRYGQGEGFGQPASDSERLRQFAYAYEEMQVRRRDAPGSLPPVEAAMESRSGGWWPAVLGLVMFVVLLALAIGLAAVLNIPR